MMQLGIVGSDNSHALGFARTANIEERFGPAVRFTMISSSDAEQATAVAAEGKIDEVVSAPEEMVGKVDAAVVVDRDGGLHRRHALPFLAVGTPVLVDKPLATTVADAVAILECAANAHSLVASYSSLRWCEDTRALASRLEDIGSARLVDVSGPCDLHSPYGGHFFYGIHLLEIALALVPAPVTSVQVASSTGVATAILRRDNGPVTMLNMLDPTGGEVAIRFPFFASVIGTKGHEATNIQSNPDLYQSLARFLHMIETGEPPLTTDEMLEPIRVLEAVSRSLEASGAEVPVPRGLAPSAP
jgi:predicted dehydrogenase